MTSVFPGKTDVPRKSYITTEAPNGHIYAYEKTYNASTYTWSGSFSTVTLPSAHNVPGIVLRETGKKLYPGANPDVDKYMVGVFIVDQDGNNYSNGLGSMFIDPNCSVFAQFNGQRPIYIPTAQDDLSGGTIGLDLGNPVYTRGDITTTNGNVRLTAAADGEGSVLVGASANPATFQNVIAVNATATANNQIITAGPITATGTTGNISATGSILSSGKTNGNGVGYATGAGENGATTVSGITGNTVNIDSSCGSVTVTGNINTGAAPIVTITSTGGKIAASDTIVISIRSTNVALLVPFVAFVAANSFGISLTNFTGGNINPLNIVINFAVIKAVTA